ncbi:MAG: NAD(P)/FAD-dependent oxidoreductase [Chitinophagaceae bacterium]
MQHSIHQEKYDYIIIGQGICGTFLSYYLLQKGCKVIVIDTSIHNSASKVASGVINPVTGRRIVRTWIIETLMPFAFDAYTAIGNLLEIDIIQQKNIIDFHTTPQMKLAFEERLLQEQEYLHLPNNESNFQEYFHSFFGAGIIAPCYWIDMVKLLSTWRTYLLNRNILLETNFDYAALSVKANEVIYESFSADKILFTDGCNGTINPYFHQLPFAKNKGEALIVSIPNLPKNQLYKFGLSLVHWKDDLWWVGSTYEWKYEDVLPTEAFKKKVIDLLHTWLKLPFTIMDHFAAERPANIERRPFVGLHPTHKNVGILNGMGTKGCSLAPYFAEQLTNHLLYQKEIDPLANVQRFSKILTRTF